MESKETTKKILDYDFKTFYFDDIGGGIIMNDTNDIIFYNDNGKHHYKGKYNIADEEGFKQFIKSYK